jgi:hypothetical protein
MFDRDKLAGVTSQIAFDDFFPMFCLIFSLSPPINAVEISDLLSKLTGAVLSPAFDFAKLFFTSTVQYLENVNLAELTRTDDDPLGLSRARAHPLPPKLSLFA